MDWYAPDNNLHGILHGSRKRLNAGSRQKKPNTGRLPIFRLWMADDNSHMQCHAHAALCHRLEKSLSERHGSDTAWHVESNMAALCKSNGKDITKPLAAWHSRGAAWEQHGTCELALSVLLNYAVTC
jgi:threonine aldolase